MMSCMRWCSVVLLSLDCGAETPRSVATSVVDAPDAVGLAELTRLDRTGGNDDGFPGAYSFVRQEDEGLVLVELDGPGVIYRIWTPTPTDDIFAFYIDGEAQPRLEIPFRQLFTGEREPFVSPVVGYGAGGFYCYLPIAFERSIKVVARAETIQFYQMNFARVSR